ncbi:hypothetical protein HF888_02395 [Bermanella marisrubri]|nr:hypothetical protein [Bermanella marisrubri]QIZ83148.1 hypothetical protein HF888_02395 [Bermanella marisrubri]
MLDISTGYVHYDGFWDATGNKKQDPANTTLTQQTLNTSYAMRLAEQWQANVYIPLTVNKSEYGDSTEQQTGLGDVQFGIWYEAFERVTCVYKITGWQSLKPSIYFGSQLTLPTGYSQHSDDVESNFDITGRGFYRWDISTIIEKTIYPWTLSYQYTHGYHVERPVNQEYSNPVDPYNKQLGATNSWSLGGGYTWFLPDYSMLSLTITHAEMKERDTQINNQRISDTGFSESRLSASLVWNSTSRDWLVKTSFSEAQAGSNYSKTQIVNIGASYVF